MRVYLGPYNSWVRPTIWLYNLLAFFYPKDKREWLYNRVRFDFDDKGLWPGMAALKRLENWADNLRPRKIKVKIHEYDTWNMADNLALIILPMLKQFRAEKTGSPWTDYEDAPEHLRGVTTPEFPEEPGDPFFHERWDWILNEIIWSFDQIVKDDDSEFWPTNAPYDREGYRAHHKRVQNGCRLFGKYYQNLWD